MRRFAVLILAAAAMLCPPQSMAHSFTGTVVRVIDGDTIIVGTNRVRLAEIDAPELRDPGGATSKAALEGMVLHKTVTVTWTHRGRYRRIIGQVYLGDEWINLWLVEQGWGWVFERYASSEAMLHSLDTVIR